MFRLIFTRFPIFTQICLNIYNESVDKILDFIHLNVKFDTTTAKP